MTIYQEAWEQYKRDNPKIFADETSGVYLENRLYLAWLAGTTFGEKNAENRIIEKVTELIRSND